MPPAHLLEHGGDEAAQGVAEVAGGDAALEHHDDLVEPARVLPLALAGLGRLEAGSGAGFDYPPNITVIMKPPCPGR